MNLKSKIFTFAAASVLSLSMMGGVMAADYVADSNVNLVAGTCALTDMTSSTASFGDWNWNGMGEYKAENPGVSNVAWLSANVRNHKPNGNCDIAVRGSNLGAIPVGNITVNTTSGGYSGVVLSGANQTGTFAAGTLSASFTLNDVPDNLQPSTYEGDITFQVSNGS